MLVSYAAFTEAKRKIDVLVGAAAAHPMHSKVGWRLLFECCVGNCFENFECIILFAVANRLLNVRSHV